MPILLAEPTAPRYISINQDTNQVRLLVPVVGGQEISTDNTCKATLAFRAFFDGGALRELTAYKEALVSDIQLLRLVEEGHPQRVLKEKRLVQIETYIGAVQAMRDSYGVAIIALMRKPSNLYGIQLRPREQDPVSRVVNPVFNIGRTNDASGTPLSALYNAMHAEFSTVTPAGLEPRAQLEEAVLSALPGDAPFADIQRTLTEQCSRLFRLDINFTRGSDGEAIDQGALNEIISGHREEALTPGDYIDALLGKCALNLSESIPTPPFYSIPAGTGSFERTERLSILTQFFLGIVNVHCKARGISDKNFGTILDKRDDLSRELVNVVAGALRAGGGVEEQIYAFFNTKTTEFELSRPLGAEDRAAITQKFETTYRTVTATKENPHMDDFLILDVENLGETGKFVVHQGSICANFAEIVDPALPNQDYFQLSRADFQGHPAEIAHKNEWVSGFIDIEPQALLERITDEQFEKLPDAVKVECRAHPAFQMRQLLSDVVKGRQDEALALLTASSPEHQQDLLKRPGVFPDYSGRTFNCTAYEGAYWAKDTHMCRMLEAHMDEQTKALMLERCEAIEATGLTYEQGGNVIEHSTHFDMTPLQTALRYYIDGYAAWNDDNDDDAIKAAWMAVGMAQRDVPVHVANEYCRSDRSFDPMPAFNEETLPRNLKFYNWTTGLEPSWFPLVVSTSAELGVHYGLHRGKRGPGVVGPALGSSEGDLWPARFDLAALIRLDEVRTADLTLSRTNLGLREPEHDHGLVP